MNQDKTCTVSILPRATPEELAPLLEKLRTNEAVLDSQVFPRGTLLGDGRLDLCKQSLGPDGTKAIAGALRENTFVKSLLLGADQMGPEGAFAIAGLLGENQSLRTIFLGCNHIGPEGAKAIAQSLVDNDRVQGLWIKRNEIGDDGAIAVAQMLASNRTLQTLDLVSNEIGIVGIRALCEALKQRQCAPIQALYLCGNNLGVEGATVIAELLRAETSIEGLFLSANHFGDEGARIIADALQENQRLLTLSMASNDIGARGAQALCEALKKNKTLTTLDLGFAPSTYVIHEQPNRIEDEGVVFLVDLLQKNQTLLSLSLNRNNISKAGAARLIEALSQNQSLMKLEFGQKLPRELNQAKTALLCRNANHQRRPFVPRQDVLDIRSVYRTATPKDDIQPKTNKKQTLHLEHLGFSREELESCQKVLRSLSVRRAALAEPNPELLEIKQLAARISRLERVELKHQHQEKKRKQRRLLDFQLIAASGIRKRRGVRTYPLPEPEESVELHEDRACYICKKAYKQLHFFYDSLCPTCATFNYEKRQQTSQLNGKIALVTGGRIKIGAQVALKLLRAGATTIVTTRFPHDAARRFAQEPDFSSFAERLHIYGLDLRALPLVERFAEHVCREYPKLDVLIQNAAQTIRKPAAFYEHLFQYETQPLAALPETERALLSRYHQSSYPFLGGKRLPAYVEVQATNLLSSNEMVSIERDEHDQPIDLRQKNSWVLELEEVSSVELVEVHAINALSPFILNAKLKPLLQKAPGDKYIVNVSAMEGQFYKFFKSSKHPHTNMAKAALNMMTRTSAQEYARERIYMNSVDTGWITDENPLPISSRMKARGFAPPLDEVDAAARILDPVFSGYNTNQHLIGEFLKDYKPTPW
jgi:NAD(P)-dependent dehydrogenase (short-subunit alcohol dehydrogenase family)/Ran GTPase-activating protein (RanGAP) involved in mRNA processing and transport